MSIRAHQGETTWVILNHVKADHWDKHKDFVFNILIPAAEKVVPTEMKQSRFLYASEPEEDGTYTSVWLMDPVVKDGNYDIQDIVQQVHGQEQGAAYFKIWTDSLDRDQVGYEVIQSKW